MKQSDHVSAHANGLKSSIHALEVQITILKQLLGGEAPAAAAPAAEEEEEDDAPATTAAADDDEDDFTAPAKKPAKAAAKGFDEEEEEEEDAPPAKPAKAAKAKKLTIDDVNDACKARAQATGGKAGRAEVLAILKKKFKTESVSDLDPEQYADCIKAMAV